MKKIIIMLIAMMLLITGCSNGGGVSGGTPGISAENFIGLDWGRPIEGCSETLHFAEDNTFHYYEACGNPVGDSDMYETYSYDDETGIITVMSPWGEGDMIIKMVSCDNDELVLDFDGQKRAFEPEEE